MWLDAFARLKIKQRLHLQFGLAVLPLVCLVGFQLLSASDLPDRVNHDLAAYRASNEAISSYRDFVNGVTDAVDSGKLSEHAVQALSAARENARQVQQQAPGPELAALVGRMQKIGQAVAVNNGIQTLVALKQDIHLVDQALKNLAAERERHLSTLVTDDDRDSRARNKVVAAILAVTLGMLALMLRHMVNRIIVPVAFAVSTAKRVAAGDLSQVLAPGKRDDGIGELQGALREMNDSLVTIVTRVNEASGLISVASDRMAAGNAELATRTTEQASSLEATAASMDELTLAVQRNSGNAQRANALVRSASDVATKGGEVVGQVVDRMSAISHSSRNIVDIIAIINELAFQTNILALNAAVEAARAGEQGRGFAVVASEVRRLAQRSAEAAQQIKALIDDSVQQIDAGSELVTLAGRTMEQVVASVRDVTQIMGEIASTSEQQSTGIRQVNHAVSELNGVTRKNSELVEEARLTADAMRDQASRLLDAVGMFSMERTAWRKSA